MIKPEQLRNIIDLNKSINDEIMLIVEKDIDKYLQEGINIAETVSMKLNEMSELIQLPINDDKIGGLIVKKKNRYYCLINTMQPRAFQNFVYLHEFYHMLHSNENFDIITDNVENDIKLDERKANYYASLMLLSRDNLRKHYYHLSKDRGYDLKTTICYLMNIFKTTYKTILIRLYEIGCIEDFTILIDNFNFNINDISEHFGKLGLDKSMIEASNAKLVSNLDFYMKQAEEKGTMLEDFIDLNKTRYHEIIDKFSRAQEK